MTIDEQRRKKSEGLVTKRELLNRAGIARALRSIAQKVLERHPDPARLMIVGIRTGGAHLAVRLRDLMNAQSKADIPFGAVDITLYRDDVFTGLLRPEVGPTDLSGSLGNKTVILVDDVLFTGRTIRAALDELMDFGRPDRVQLAVLVDRGHRELPIQADFVGLTVETTREQTVRVMLDELGETDKVVLCERKKP